MNKLSIALDEIIEANSFLQFGLYHQLLNLTHLAVFLKPLIETRTKKDLVSASALTMALSRLQKEKSKQLPPINDFAIENITAHSRLVTITYSREQKFLEHLGSLYHLIQKNNGYISLNQGTNEVTIITDETSARQIRKATKHRPKNITDNLAALSIKYNEKYFTTPGLLYYLMQQISLQGINILEISSTYTEITIYVDQKDLKLLFDTIYNQFTRSAIKL